VAWPAPGTQLYQTEWMDRVDEPATMGSVLAS
jgi:hypothetical protein